LGWGEHSQDKRKITIQATSHSQQGGNEDETERAGSRAGKTRTSRGDSLISSHLAEEEEEEERRRKGKRRKKKTAPQVRHEHR